jgi:hypothetical protein
VLFSSDNVTPLIYQRLCHPLKKTPSSRVKFQIPNYYFTGSTKKTSQQKKAGTMLRSCFRILKFRNNYLAVLIGMMTWVKFSSPTGRRSAGV